MYFFVFKTPKKTNENNLTWGTSLVKLIFFVHFLGELNRPKRYFKINWHLGWNKKKCLMTQLFGTSVYFLKSFFLLLECIQITICNHRTIFSVLSKYFDSFCRIADFFLQKLRSTILNYHTSKNEWDIFRRLKFLEKCIKIKVRIHSHLNPSIALCRDLCCSNKHHHLNGNFSG